MEITKREILVSISFLLIMIVLGIFISNKIVYYAISKRELYNKSLKINNDIDTFKYALDTEIGNILSYGNFKVESGVKFDELSNDYTSIKKITERYTEHTKKVCDDDDNCHTETYHTWDEINTDTKNVGKIKFNNIEFNLNLFTGYNFYELDLNENTVNKSYIKDIHHNYIYEDYSVWTSVGDLRYSFYVVDKNFNGTIFAKAKEKTIKPINDNSINIEYMTINELMDSIKNSETISLIIFWIIYLLIIGVIIYAYIEHENKYLED